MSKSNTKCVRDSNGSVRMSRPFGRGPKPWIARPFLFYQKGVHPRWQPIVSTICVLILLMSSLNAQDINRMLEQSRQYFLRDSFTLLLTEEFYKNSAKVQEDYLRIAKIDDNYEYRQGKVLTVFNKEFQVFIDEPNQMIIVQAIRDHSTVPQALTNWSNIDSTFAANSQYVGIMDGLESYLIYEDPRNTQNTLLMFDSGRAVLKSIERSYIDDNGNEHTNKLRFDFDIKTSSTFHRVSDIIQVKTNTILLKEDFQNYNLNYDPSIFETK